MTLICLGSTIFTILSLKLGANTSPDRIASNIITGIGFIGAGVIFKDGITISGLTTATSIWVTAALRMAAGAGNLGLCAIGLSLVLIVLAFFDRLQDAIDDLHQKRSYKFEFATSQLAQADLDERLRRFGVSFKLRRVSREASAVSCWYDVWGNTQVLSEFSEFCLNAEEFRSVEYIA
jgi:putative Mg2+ transporter-C (MgtC) family protein